MSLSTCSLPSLSELPLDSVTPNRNISSSKLDIANLLSSPPPSPTSCHYNDVKIKRKRASPDQLAVLSRVFSQTYFPSTEVRRALGKQLGMSPRTVQIWFQNKRQALRTRGRQVPQEHSPCYLPPISPPTSPTFDMSFQNRQNISLPPLRFPNPPQCHSSNMSLPIPSSIDYFYHREF